jgi:hypothetical protein
MLLGFPLDFWATYHIHNVIASFGKVLTWEDDLSNLSRLLAKAQVTYLEDIPKFFVFFETEGFLGQTWTIQCELMHQDYARCLAPR